jgi:hypothetical protein
MGLTRSSCKKQVWINDLSDVIWTRDLEVEYKKFVSSWLPNDNFEGTIQI